MKFPSKQQRSCMKFQSVTFRGHLCCLLCWVFCLFSFVFGFWFSLFQVARWTGHRCNCFSFLTHFSFLCHTFTFSSEGKVKPLLLQGKKYSVMVLTGYVFKNQKILPILLEVSSLLCFLQLQYHIVISSGTEF